ncbi:MAG: hypothetical protein JW759_06990 [Candidatus Coatesbacteria bacterium]|nr:hypothetical protein [Candidatus Coatesbacteria bacterium]
MKRSRRMCIAVGTLAVVGVAICALAGWFYTDGTVAPTMGYADETDFLYSIVYQLAPGQETPPNVFLELYNGGYFDSEHMMGVAWFSTPYVCYEYSTKLAAGNWGFQFKTVDDETITYVGPTVW